MPNQRPILTSVLCLVLALCSIFLFYVWGGQELLGIDPPPPIDPIIAISLGNTNSRVAFFENGTTHIIPNAQGHNATPSYFAFSESNHVLGDEAKALAGMQLSHGSVISGFTKYLGHNFTSMQSLTGLGEYDLVDRDGVPKYRVYPPFGDVVEYSPRELTAFLLQSLRQDAERYLGTKVKRAVVVAGDDYDDALRNDIRDAGKLVDLEIVRIPNRSSSVTRAHDIAEKKKEIIALVYHLGSSYAEVTVGAVEEEVYETFSHSLDTPESPTAQKLKQKIVEFIVDALDPFYALDPVEQEMKSIDLQFEAERVQRILSSKNKVEIQDRGKSVNLSRSKLEELLDSDLKRTLEYVDKAITEAKVSISEIDVILLSGGSSNIPKVKAMLEEHLGKPIIQGKDFNPEEAALFGAAKIANWLMYDPPYGCEFGPVTKWNIGVETIGGFIERLAYVGTNLPTKKSGVFTTVIDKQKMAVVNLYEWWRPFTKDGNLLATLTLNDIPPAPAGKVQIEIILEIDEDEVITITALHQQTGRSETISVNTTHSTEEQFSRTIEEYEKFKADDEVAGEKIKKLVAEGQLVGKDGDIRRMDTHELWPHEEL